MFLTEGFVELARMYVETMNEDGIPCIANAVELLKNNECQKALDGALSAFVQIMDNNLKGNVKLFNVKRVFMLEEVISVDADMQNFVHRMDS